MTGFFPGEVLLAGESISAGRNTLTMQADGNLVLYAPGSIPVWASNTAGHGGAQLVMQADGDAILHAPGNVTLWFTNTSKQTYAVVQLPAHAGDRTSSAA